MLLNCSVGETLEGPLDCREIQPVHPKGDQSWVFTGGTDVEAETPILWPPDVKSWLIGKDPDAGKDWGQEEKWTTEDRMVGWHHQHNGHRFGWTLGVDGGQGGLACCGSWGHKKSDTTEWLNWTELSKCSEHKVCDWVCVWHFERNIKEVENMTLTSWVSFIHFRWLYLALRTQYHATYETTILWVL